MVKIFVYEPLQEKQIEAYFFQSKEGKSKMCQLSHNFHLYHSTS